MKIGEHLMLEELVFLGKDPATDQILDLLIVDRVADGFNSHDAPAGNAGKSRRQRLSLGKDNVIRRGNETECQGLLDGVRRIFILMLRLRPLDQKTAIYRAPSGTERLL